MWSLGFATSPFQLFPTRMFSGLLFLIPLGILFFLEDIVQLLYVVIKSEDAACQQEGLRDVHQCSVGYVINIEYLVKRHRDA